MYFYLYPDCLVVEGAAMTTVCDAQKNRYIRFRTALWTAAREHARETEHGALCWEPASFAGAPSEAVVLRFLDYLEDSGMGFRVEAPVAVGAMVWELPYPSAVNNAVLDRASAAAYALEDALQRLYRAGCRTFQLRYFPEAPEALLASDLTQFSEGAYPQAYVEPVVRLERYDAVRRACQENGIRLGGLVVYGTGDARADDVLPGGGRVAFLPHDLTDESCCGRRFGPAVFNCNTRFLAESQHVNNCLIGKVSVDRHGTVKNCPTFQSGYGPIGTADLPALLRDPAFRRVGAIAKSELETCRACEYRLICMDCRAHNANADRLYEKPLHCTYDPFSGTWA